MDGLAPNEVIQYFLLAQSNLHLVSQRDCLVKVQKMKNYPSPGHFTYAYNHYVHDKFPPNKNSLIRTDTIMTGYRFKPAPKEYGGTIVDWI